MATKDLETTLDFFQSRIRAISELHGSFIKKPGGEAECVGCEMAKNIPDLCSLMLDIIARLNPAGGPYTRVGRAQ